MATPTFEQMKHWAEQYVALWNAGDKEAWAANWRAIAPGDFRMLDPVGTPEKRGFEHCCLDSFDLFQPKVKFRIAPGQLFICGNEVAWVMVNIFRKDGEEQHLKSIETYRFGDDGSCEIRTHYDVPPADDPITGQLFAEYLPGDT